MKRKIIIIGGSKGIGNAIINTLLPTFDFINLSRSAPENFSNEIVHFTFDVTIDELPEIYTPLRQKFYDSLINLSNTNQHQYQYYNPFQTV